MVRLENVGTFPGNESGYDFGILSLLDNFNLDFLSNVFENQVYNQALICSEAINIPGGIFYHLGSKKLFLKRCV